MKPLVGGHKMFPALKQSYKHNYPFRLSVPSFIYPADYVTNVERLGPFVDEIELLFFESAPESLPTTKEIDHLKRAAGRLDITYNVHLPLDLALGSRNIRERHRAVSSLTEILERVRPLAPTTHTLHLTIDGYDIQDGSAVGIWQERCVQSLENLLSASRLMPEMISIETLDYPPHLFAPIVERLNTAVCLDVGHILRYGFDLESILQRHAERIAIFHLHGVAGDRDHLSLTALSDDALRTVTAFIAIYTGTVSLEVFSFDRLASSLLHLAETMGSGPIGKKWD